MAQTNYTPISLYYSTTASAAPTAGNLVNGELAINITDGKLYYKDNTGTVKVIAGSGGTGIVAGSNTQIQFNNNGVFGASANLTWDGSFLTVASIKDSALTSGRVTFAGASGLLSDAAGLTWDGTYLTANSIKNSALTSGRVTYAGASGLLQDSANLTFDGTTLTANALTVSNAVTFSGGTANGVAYLNGSKVLTTGSALTFDGAANFSFVGTGLYPVVSVSPTGNNAIFGFRMDASAGNGVDWRVEQGRSAVGDFNVSAPGLNAAPQYTIRADLSAQYWSLGAAGEKMRITTTGLGLGTSTPISSIGIFGATGNSLGISIQPSGWSYYNRIGPNGSAGNQFFISQNWNAAANTVDSSSYGTTAIRMDTGDIAFLTGVTNTVPSAKVTVAQNGRVTINNGEYTVINGSVYGKTPSATGFSLGFNPSGGSGESQLVWGTSGSTYPFIISSYDGSSTTERARFNTSGVLSVGTTNAYGRLTLNGSLQNSFQSSTNSVQNNDGAMVKYYVSNPRDASGGSSNRVIGFYGYSADEGGSPAQTMYFARMNNYYGQQNINYDSHIYYHSTTQYHYRAYSAVGGYDTWWVKPATNIDTVSGTRADMYLSGLMGVGTTNPAAYGGKLVAFNGTSYPYTYAIYKSDTSQSILSLAYEGGSSFTNGYKAGINFASDFVPNGSYAAQNKWFVGIYATADGVGNANLAFYDQKNGTERMTLTMAGRLGIGKSPNSLLDAYGCFDAQNAQLTSGSTVDIPINAGIGNAVLFLVLIASNANSNANSSALLLVNTRSWAYGGGNTVALVSSTQGSTGTSNEPGSQSYTLSGSGSNVYLRVGASCASGSSFTVYTRMITVV